MAKVDYEYETTEERVRAYLQIPEIDRLRWLEELCIFTSLVRQAPTTDFAPEDFAARATNRRDEGGS